jgi:septum formation protein
LPPPLILASRSAARAALLERARVPFETVAAAVDETAVKQAMAAEGAPARDVADALAELKAQRVAARHPGRLVLGADQVLVADGHIYDKPADREEARAQLLVLGGRSHQLLSAAVVFEEGRPVWRHIGRADLVMRPLGEAFVDRYLDAEGDAVLDSVGAYRIEEGGAVLFAQVRGDIFTIMGLPLLELLAFLRTRGIVPE